MNNQCVDCGLATGGIRCRKCNGRFEREQAALRLADPDTELLAMVDSERLSPARLATRLGISRNGAYLRLKRARARQAIVKRLA